MPISPASLIPLVRRMSNVVNNSPEWEQFSKRLSAYGTGVADNVIKGAAMYPALGANVAGNVANNTIDSMLRSLTGYTGFDGTVFRNDQELQDTNRGIREIFDEYPGALKPVSDYKNWLNQEEPNMADLGNTASILLGGAGTPGSAINLGKGVISAIQHKLARYPMVVGTGVAAGTQYGPENFLDTQTRSGK